MGRLSADINPVNGMKIALVLTIDGKQQSSFMIRHEKTDVVLDEYTNLRSRDGSMLAWSGPEETGRKTEVSG